MDPAVLRDLDAYFAPYNRKLHELIGTDLSW